ncbi:MAG: polyisoprenoid-binding protein [Chitinophagaceae bacterium]|nr:MAG: polyisoprenoid-binding protein [Chitinophagaceae bacterium]
MPRLCLCLCVVFLLVSFNVYPQSHVPVAGESKVEFKIRNFGFNVNGKFGGLAGKIVFDPASLSGSGINVSIDANSIDTDNNTRDNHLRKEDYFDVKNYPRIQFVSTKIANGKKSGDFVITGKLTIKKTTREISFPFTAKSLTNGYRLKGEFKINRRDFGVGGNSTVSDNLLVCLDVVTRKSEDK